MSLVESQLLARVAALEIDNAALKADKAVLVARNAKLEREKKDMTTSYRERYNIVLSDLRKAKSGLKRLAENIMKVSKMKKGGKVKEAERIEHSMKELEVRVAENTKSFTEGVKVLRAEVKQMAGTALAKDLEGMQF
jgi:soluble cytochrome b562